MWLINSSVGRKVVMSITGASLVLFLLFHASMNLVAIISEEGYNMICEFLGANWYALVATAGLAGLVVLHILYAFILTVQNYRARGSQRYAVSANQKDVSHMAGVADVDIANATNGVYWIKETFANPIYVGLYLVWLAAIWFHLTHGVWSAMHSLGLNNGIWMKRVKCISNIVSTLVVLMFAVVVVYYFAMSLCA